MMQTDLAPKHWLLVILFLLFSVYCLFQARFLILGPRISITEPMDGERAEGSLITVSGRARNAAWLSLNDRQIFTDEEGYWSERLIVQGDVSIMTVRVRDRFGREREKSVRIILN